MIVAPNSPRPRANATAAAVPSPAAASGSATRAKTRAGRAPSVRAASTGVAGLRRAEPVDDLERRRSREEAGERQQEERERRRGRQSERSREEALHEPGGIGPKPAACRIACPRFESTRSTNARAAAWCFVDFKIAIS